MEKLQPDHTKAGRAGTSSAIRSRRNQIDNLQEYDTSYGLAGVARFRVNIYRQRGTLRLHPAHHPG